VLRAPGRAGTMRWLLGDRDGVVVIPKAMLDEAVARTEAVLGTESQVRNAIRAGTDPQEAYKKYAKF
jgi:4-hydroxy-4-methyl-2-oxoglutarate aldolase